MAATATPDRRSLPTTAGQRLDAHRTDSAQFEPRRGAGLLNLEGSNGSTTGYRLRVPPGTGLGSCSD